MEICMVCPEIGNSRGAAFLGGHVNNVLKLSKALHNKAHNITIITTPHRHPGDQSNWNIGYAEVINLPIKGAYPSLSYGLEFISKATKKIISLNNNKNIDILHGHSGYSTLGIITGIGSSFTKIPSIHSLYSPIEPVSSRKLVMVCSNKYLSRFCLSQIDIITVASKNIQRSLMEAGIVDSKIKIIPPGIDTDVHHPIQSKELIRNQLGIPPDCKLLLFIGNLTETKGIRILIEALAKIIKIFPEIKLLMVLNMPLSKYEFNSSTGLYDQEDNFEIKELIKQYGLNDAIIPLGLINNLPKVMAASDILIVPFINTVGVLDYPLSLLEGMACGLPVIATNVGGIPEIISNNKNGLLIEKNDINSLGDALLYLLENLPIAELLGNNAAKYASENFGINKMAEEYEKVYKHISNKVQKW